MAMNSRRITFKTHLWVCESKQIYWDLPGIPSHVGISGDEFADSLARQAVDNGTVHGQMAVTNDHSNG
jgi:hypothetical protein